MGYEANSKFNFALQALIGTVRTARKNRCNLATHPFYSRRGRSGLAALRKALLLLKRTYPPDASPGVASQVSQLEGLMARATDTLASNPIELLRLLEEMAFITSADLAAELDGVGAGRGNGGTPLFPEDIIDDRRGILRKVLHEANKCYEVECFNASAAMIRRLVESLIIEAFEHHVIAETIKASGEYLEFGALIGKATGEPKLGLTRTARRGLPDLKFLGDLGAHNRKALVRRDDLDRVRNQARLAVEELARASS